MNMVKQLIKNILSQINSGYKHVFIGILSGILITKVLMITNMPNLIIFAFMMFIFITLAWQQAQRLNSKLENYWMVKGVDTICDVIGGNAGYLLGMMISLGYLKTLLGV